jgi:hypothetical protein
MENRPDSAVFLFSAGNLQEAGRYSIEQYPFLADSARQSRAGTGKIQSHRNRSVFHKTRVAQDCGYFRVAAVGVGS